MKRSHPPKTTYNKLYLIEEEMYNRILPKLSEDGNTGCLRSSLHSVAFHPDGIGMPSFRDKPHRDGIGMQYAWQKPIGDIGMETLVSI